MAKYTARTRVKMDGKRYMPGEGLDLSEEQAKALGDAVEKGAPRNAPEPEKQQDADPLEGVAFASPQAALKAKEFGLAADAFKGETKSGEGGFTVEDVEKIADKATK